MGKQMKTIEQNLERIADALEILAKNSSGKPTDTSALEAAAGKTAGKTTEKTSKAATKTSKAATKTSKEAKKPVKEPAEQAEEANEPSPEELKEAQAFKKKLLDLGRGSDNYIERLKAVLARFGFTAEKVPADMRDEVAAAVVAEFEADTDGDI